MSETEIYQPVAPLHFSEEEKARLRFMYIAKHALRGGGMDPEDGNHAVYHHEMRQTLESLGINLKIATSYDALYTKPDVDLVFPMLNRGGFMNSEMLLPLLCNMHGLPYVGASPFIRGLGDDKSVSKLVATHAGLPTAPWFCYRRGAPVLEADCPKAGDSGDRWVIKPNASSASWEISDAHDWAGVEAAIARIHAEGYDAIVEPYLDGYDVQVAFISVNGPQLMPMLIYEREDTQRLWTYQEKRDLVENTEKATLKQFTDPEFADTIADMACRFMREIEPFDFGRIEFRLNRDTGEINFIEVNLNCNLWSEKVMAKSAAVAGFSHADLLETILVEASRRNGLID